MYPFFPIGDIVRSIVIVKRLVIRDITGIFTYVQERTNYRIITVGSLNFLEEIDDHVFLKLYQVV